MGASTSKGKKHQEMAKYGQVYLQTDKSVYVAGETVTGRVYINLVLPFPGSQLYLKFKGKEMVNLVIEETHGTDQNDRRDELYTEKKEIIKNITPVYTWPTLMPGQYEIPFAFMLPNTLPASFHQEGYRYAGFVGYKIEAYLQPHSSDMSKLKYKQALIIREPIRSVMQGYTNENTVQLKSCCCCSQGSNTLKASFEKNYYVPGEQANVIFTLDNGKSSLANSKMVFALKQRVNLMAKKNVKNQEFTKVNKELPGVPAGQANQDTSLAIVLPPAKKDNYGETPKYTGTMQLCNLKEDNSMLSSSTKSSLITSEYYLEVYCPMDGCCSNQPSITCPIQIYQPEFQFAVVTPPMNWAPQAVPNVNVAFAPQMGFAPQVGGNVPMMQSNMASNDYPPMQQGNMQYGQNFYGNNQGQPVQGQYGNGYSNQL